MNPTPWSLDWSAKHSTSNARILGCAGLDSEIIYSRCLFNFPIKQFPVKLCQSVQVLSVNFEMCYRCAHRVSYFVRSAGFLPRGAGTCGIVKLFYLFLDALLFFALPGGGTIQ